ncbi:hypothetical protein GCM10010273_04160 [Streptomyces lavendulocolor]
METFRRSAPAVGGVGCLVLRRGMLGLSLRSSYVRAPPASGPATLTPAQTTPGLGPPRKGDAQWGVFRA